MSGKVDELICSRGESNKASSVGEASDFPFYKNKNEFDLFHKIYYGSDGFQITKIALLQKEAEDENLDSLQYRKATEKRSGN